MTALSDTKQKFMLQIKTVPRPYIIFICNPQVRLVRQKKKVTQGIKYIFVTSRYSWEAFSKRSHEAGIVQCSHLKMAIETDLLYKQTVYANRTGHLCLNIWQQYEIPLFVASIVCFFVCQCVVTIVDYSDSGQG